MDDVVCLFLPRLLRSNADMKFYHEGRVTGLAFQELLKVVPMAYVYVAPCSRTTYCTKKISVQCFNL